ncbi:hypothetical protein QLQ12_36690 [Actinoplanes sp. NEAU-A12]|uniref:PPE family domain-containing protein n=1 Tax=Actinoplanes sandaracinus TaxID=3045177 RepID=A0ABT6WWP8_9ACTN|nr:hypothetical protein [Actinoplanes sandaracinus]MDI6104145.1 hypothetical protein [Actinoplanes sandaracinus]
MLTLTELRDARVDALDTAADAWTALARLAEDLASDAVTELARPLRGSGWDGDAAAARTAAAALNLTEAGIPAAGGDHRAAHDWWAGRSPEERHLYATAWPDRVGALDGLPATDRDQANQLALRNYIGDSVNRRDDQDNSQHDRAVNLLDKLKPVKSSRSRSGCTCSASNRSATAQRPWRSATRTPRPTPPCSFPGSVPNSTA